MITNVSIYNRFRNFREKGNSSLISNIVFLLKVWMFSTWKWIKEVVRMMILVILNYLALIYQGFFSQASHWVHNAFYSILLSLGCLCR